MVLRESRRRPGLIALALCLTAALWLPAIARADTAPFSYTGGTQTWTVPAGVHQASFDLYGAQGGAGACLNWGVAGCGGTPGGAGGFGARFQAVIAVTPGQVLQILIGGMGSNGAERTSMISTGAGAAGFNGGGVGGAGAWDGFNANGSGGGGGGGASDVRSGTYTLAERILVAAGGGGGGAGGAGLISNPMAPCSGHANGGFSGGAGGSSGSNGSSGGYGNAGPGSTGTDSTGGDGGTTATPGGSSPAGDGADGDISNGGAGGAASGASTGGGGGGGGGLYAAGGGGGGASASGTSGCPMGITWNDFYAGAGGGGGASYAASPIGTPTLTDGNRSGPGALSIDYEVQPDVLTGGASAVTTDSASVAGTVNPNSRLTDYHFEYGEDAFYGSSTPEASAGDGSTASPVSALLTGLDPGTTYHYRVVATTCAGCAAGTDEGDDATFTTQSLADPDLAGAPVSFGNLAQTKVSGARNLVVRNAASSPSESLEVNAVALGGANPSQFRLGASSCAGSSLAAGATCTIPVSFTPTSLGSKAATLLVTTSAGNLSAALSGTGTKTGRRARALRRCKSKPTRRARRNCRKRARKLPA